MGTESLSLLVEPEVLEQHLDDTGLRIVDLSKADTYRQYHVPGAVHLDYASIVHAEKPAMGLLPNDEHLSQVFSALGITADTHVVAYDDEGGGRACRLLWTLDVVGHRKFSLLNGGLHAWANEGHPLSNEPVQIVPSSYDVRRTEKGIADKDYVLAHLKDADLALLDTRTPEEFSGLKRYAERGGHIPGAVNMNWVLAMDDSRNLRLLPESQLRPLLKNLDVTPDKEVITYCQTHHCSAHTYIVLKTLGYQKVRGYHGAWSEWGNDPNTPVER
jgi:thiosulfate/3-mercaptopyruvate sulfurtransferase